MTVGEVVESRADGFAPGDTVWHASGWRDYAVVQAGDAGPRRCRHAEEARRLRDAAHRPTSVSSARNGLTAYAGLFRVAGLRDGDVVWVSAAAGAVGSLVVQMAKIRGHRVIGSAGSAEKVRYLLEELGADAAFDYRPGRCPSCCGRRHRTGSTSTSTTSAATTSRRRSARCASNGRVAMCGAISEYDAAEPPPGPSNLFLLVAKNLTVRGFRGSSHVELMDDMLRDIGGWLRDGRIRYQETVVDGLENAPTALARLMRGDTSGKTRRPHRLAEQRQHLPTDAIRVPLREVDAHGSCADVDAGDSQRGDRP